MTSQEEFDSNDLLAQQIGIHGQAGQIAQQTAAQQYYTEEKEKSIADAQLEVNETLEKLYHMLRQDVYKYVDGQQQLMEWIPVADNKRVLTEEGVDRMMQAISFYINKENLLSNFNEDQINEIMLTFRKALNANHYTKYEVWFRIPTFEECKIILENKIQEQVKIKEFANELIGNNLSKDDIKKELLKKIEFTVHKEIKKIKEVKIKENLKEWELMFEGLAQMVFATLNRAWKGEERGSLRRHMNVTELLGARTPQPQQARGFKLWGR